MVAREGQLLKAEVVYGYETAGNESNKSSAQGWRAL